MEAFLRSEMNQSSVVLLTAADVLAALNDGEREVASRALCKEVEDTVVTDAGSCLVKFSGYRVNQVSIVAVDQGVQFSDSAAVEFAGSGVVWTEDPAVDYINIGIPCIMPTNVGEFKSKTAIYGWFNWGRYVYLYPTPTVRYVLRLYISDYPTAQLVNAGDSLSVPNEFMPCVLDWARFALSLKLRNYRKASQYYNIYAQNLMTKKAAFDKRKVEERAMKTQYDKVVIG
jgi:hypothetical protein